MLTNIEAPFRSEHAKRILGPMMRLIRLDRRSAVVAAVSDLANDVAFGDDSDRRLMVVDDDEAMDPFSRPAWRLPPAAPTLRWSSRAWS